MEPFAKIVNGFQLLTIFAKRSILGIWQGSEYASVYFKSEISSKNIIRYIKK